jgi:hypothetical protein
MLLYYNLHSCKPGRIEYFTTNMMAPRFNNSAVAWSFSGRNGVSDAGGVTRFSCTRPGLVPSILSLDASWGFRTAFNFSLSRDMPLRDGGLYSGSPYRSYYYEFNVTELRARIESQYGAAAQESIIFRAEYVCNCPGTCSAVQHG